MTTDERLDRLTERHEALTQSLELLTLDVRDLTSDVRDLTSDVRNLTSDVRDLAVKFNALVGIMEKTNANIDSLVVIVTNHQQRLDRIEGI